MGKAGNSLSRGMDDVVVGTPGPASGQESVRVSEIDRKLAAIRSQQAQLLAARRKLVEREAKSSKERKPKKEKVGKESGSSAPEQLQTSDGQDTARSSKDVPHCAGDLPGPSLGAVQGSQVAGEH